MRNLVVADVHSNLAAFEAVIADATRTGPIEAIWSLGDLVGYGPEPGSCIALLRSYSHVAVGGNHDYAAAGVIGVEDFNPLAAAAARWTAEVLSAEDKVYLLGLPPIATEGEFTLVHGSLNDPVWEYLMSREQARDHLDAQPTRFGLVGHTHLPLVFSEEEPDIGMLDAASGTAVTLDGSRFVANPGSVGQPRDGDPRAAYALVDTAARALSFHRVAYDIERTQSRMRSLGLPSPLIDRLSRGR